MRKKHSILIVASVWQEVEPFIKNYNCFENCNHTFCIHTDLFDIKIFVAGIGSVFTTYNLTNHLKENNYSLVLDVGVCGAYEKNNQIGTIAFCWRSVHAGFGFYTQDGGYQSFAESKFWGADKFPFSNGFIENNLAKKIANLCGRKYATFNSVDKTDNSLDNIAFIKKNHPAEFETMESYAFNFVCKMMRVNFAEARCVSNVIIAQERGLWNLPLATNVLGQFLQQLLATDYAQSLACLLDDIVNKENC